MLLGSYVTYNKDNQLLGCVKEAISYGDSTFMFYTGAPQNTIRVKIDDELSKEAIKLMKDNGIDFDKVVVHAPYIINLANSKDKSKYNFSIRFLKEELKRCEQYKVKYLVLHPGSHVGIGIDQAIDNIIKALNDILKDTNVVILLETMSGKGTEVGSHFDELKRIIDGVSCPEKLGVCMDICHMHDSGYNLSDFDALLDEFDSIIGIDFIKCIHLNDSKNEIGAKKDRHENIGFGKIGFENILNVVYNERMKDVPKILETPWIDKLIPLYKEEIIMLKERKFNPNIKNKIN